MVIVFLLGLYLAGEVGARIGKLPPAEVGNLREYLDWRPEANQFARLPDGRLIAFGPGVGLWPSGPSATLFDTTGELLDSTPDFSGTFEGWNIKGPLQMMGREGIGIQQVRKGG